VPVQLSRDGLPPTSAYRVVASFADLGF
jgi:hypothetical protein